MTALLISLLQLTAALLTNAAHNPSITPEEQVRVISTAGMAIQFAVEASGSQSVPGGDGNIWPNYSQLLRARYLTAGGSRVPLGGEVKLDNGTISFGDINGDGLDDAIVVVVRSLPGSSEYQPAFAVMLNQGGGNLFNIGDFPLPKGYILFDDHHIENRQFNADMKLPDATRRMYHYTLVGMELLEI